MIVCEWKSYKSHVATKKDATLLLLNTIRSYVKTSACDKCAVYNITVIL